tara:strand:+ start:6637 stop:7038 length:402 start_codon:yes stop_codon:yes gene_type:complete
MSTDTGIQSGAISITDKCGPQVHGTVRVILPVEEAGQNQKQVIVIDTDEEYTQTLAVEFFGNSYIRCSEKIAELKVGDSVKVGFKLRGCEYNKKDNSGVGYFNSISGWSVYTKAAATAPASDAAPAADEEPPF